ncbi:MAG: type IV pili twitching motility protein PilT, partial [Aquificaceae bacterium]
MLQLILKRAVELGASDIHLKTASPPVIRLKKKLHRLSDFPVIDERVMEMFLNEVLGKNRRKLAEFEELGETDT